MRHWVMKFLTAILTILAIVVAMPSQARDRTLLLTRDGAFYDVTIKKISRNRVVFFNNRHKSQGKIKLNTKLVYAVLDDKGSNVFFDENGRQRIIPSNGNDLKGTILFLKNFQFFPVYDLRINSEGLFYKISDNKNSQYYKQERENVFMVKHEDMHVTLFSSKYVCAPGAEIYPYEKKYVPAPRQDVHASVFQPSILQEAKPLYDSVCKVNPYTLYKPGIMMEYGFQKKGYIEDVNRVSYIRQQVADVRANKGMIVPYVMQMIYNDNHGRVRGVPSDYYEYMFPVEIDGEGNYQLSHNIVQDLMEINSRHGFGVLIPGNLQPGQRLACGTIVSTGKSFSGKKMTVQSTFKEWHVVEEVPIFTEAGKFNCMKLRGLIYESKDGKKPTVYKVACYLAKGLGVICYDSLPLDGKTEVPLTMCVTRIQDNSKKK